MGHEWAPQNRLVALDYLRGLTDQGDLSLQETCILSWGQIARSVDISLLMERSLIYLLDVLEMVTS